MECHFHPYRNSLMLKRDPDGSVRVSEARAFENVRVRRRALQGRSMCLLRV